VRRHLGDDGLGEHPGLGRGPDQHGGAGAGHNLGQADTAVGVPPAGDFGGLAGVPNLVIPHRSGVITGEQALAVQRVEPAGGLGGRQAVIDHRLPQHVRDPDPGGARTVDHHRLVPHRRPRGAGRAQGGGQHHGGGALDVVVEGAARVGVLGQDAMGVGRAEVFPVQHRVREQPGRGTHISIDQLVILLAPHPRMPVAQVHGVIKQGLVVGPGVQHHRDDPARVQPGRGDVQGQLADGDRDAADAPVADAEDALGVGSHDQVDVVAAQPVVAEGRLDLAGIIHRQVDPARTAVLQAVPFDRGAHRRGVHDRQHLGDVLGEQPVEQHLVPVPQTSQVQVLGQVAGLAPVLRVHPRQLPLDRRDARGQQAGQAQRLPLGERERGTPVQHRRGQHRAAP
jgi:hypothetical protein